MFKHILSFIIGISIPLGILGACLAYKAYEPPSLECIARMYEPYNTGVIIQNHSYNKTKITNCEFEVVKYVQASAKGSPGSHSEEIVFLVGKDKLPDSRLLEIYWTGADIIIYGKDKQKLWFRVKDKNYPPGCLAVGNIKLQYGKSTLEINGIVVDVESD